MHLELTGISTTSRSSTSAEPGKALVQHQQDLVICKSIEFIEQRQRRLQRVHQVKSKGSTQQERYAQDRVTLPGPPSRKAPGWPSPQSSSQSSGRVLQGVNLHVAARRHCRPGCVCACHAQERNQTPSALDRIFGQLFVGYAGIPVLSANRDDANCRKSQRPQIQAEYWFLAGVFWNQIIRFQATYQANLGPAWQFNTLRRVPDGAEAVTFAMTGNIDGLKSLFTNGYASPVDVNETRGYSLLRTCQFLVDNGADPDYRPKALSDDCPRNKASDIILQGGMPEDDITALRCMTRDSDWIDDQNFLRVHKIATGQDGADLAEELRKHPESVNAPDAMGRTPLLWAAARGDAVACIALLNFDADPNIIDVYWSGPVAYSADRNHTGCTRILLEAGSYADVEIPGGCRFVSPLNCAARNASDPVLIKTLIDFHAKVDACGVDGRTFLIHAARTNNLAFAQILIDADINAVTITNHTPLTTAIMNNSHDVLELLLKPWKDYNVCPRLTGPNLLGLAAQYADLDTIKILSNMDHLRLKYDLTYSTGEFIALLTNRHDADETLCNAFKLFLQIVREQLSQEETTEAGSPSQSHSRSPSFDFAKENDRVRELRDEVSAMRVDDGDDDPGARRHIPK
ncbi:ankyrin repeat-containing domain protein [Massariosphaeria phaeospora]|uniref:Ankyrin repeat-containing domain protein n=1 Tax=Massariosphaeria phaeospora TaxID=100035 RepID=A0A7C8M5S5_9PLEO|nr:ankyrin repeat-containing domain protein [Massariosphaeria phaeospora]